MNGKITMIIWGCALCLSSVFAIAGNNQNAEKNDLLNQALRLKSRAGADIERDKRSKPATVLALTGLKPGHVVADIFAGGGYYSEILAHVVGKTGKVFVHNNKAYRQFVGDALEKRFADKSLSQIQIYDTEVDNFGLKPSSLDLAIIIMSYHDLYHVDEKQGWPAIDAKHFLGQIRNALKSGGQFLIVDHHAKPGSGKKSAQKLHRLEESFAIKDIESNGFRLIDKSNALRNPNDDHSKNVFNAQVRGKTDRFVLLFEKP